MWFVMWAKTYGFWFYIQVMIFKKHILFVHWGQKFKWTVAVCHFLVNCMHYCHAIRCYGNENYEKCNRKLSLSLYHPDYCTQQVVLGLANLMASFKCSTFSHPAAGIDEFNFVSGPCSHFNQKLDIYSQNWLSRLICIYSLNLSATLGFIGTANNFQCLTHVAVSTHVAVARTNHAQYKGRERWSQLVHPWAT